MQYKETATGRVINERTYAFKDIKHPTSNFLLYSEEELLAIGVSVYTPPPAEPAPYIPQTVTPAQARAELHIRGLLEQAEQIVAEHPYPLVQIYWKHATEIDRNNAYINGIAYELGIDDLDEVFVSAAERQF